MKTLQSYLPPPVGVIREGAVVPGHQRENGLIEAVSQPSVAPHICHARITCTDVFGEKAARNARSILEEMKGGVAEGEAEQQSRAGEGAAEEKKSQEFVLTEWRHPLQSRISFGAQQTTPP